MIVVMAEIQIPKKSSYAKIFNRLQKLWFAGTLGNQQTGFACPARTKIFLFLGALAICQLLLLATCMLPSSISPSLVTTVQLLIVSVSFGSLLLLAHFFQRDFLIPLMHLRHWVHMMRGGNLRAQIPVVKDAEFADLAEDLNVVGMMLLRLSEDADFQLQEHTRHITSKTRSLQILYNLAANISYSADMEELLNTALHTIFEVINADAATVRMVEGSHYRLVKTLEAEHFEPFCKSHLNIHDSSFGYLVQSGQIVWENPVKWTRDKQQLERTDGMQVVSVPLVYRNKTLGVFSLLVSSHTPGQQEDINSVLLSIGQHCGMAIEKLRLDREAQRLTIMEEREHLSHELHDSLAQTLVSLRFQVRVLDETIESDDKKSIWQQMERIENTVDEANTELRELITHFRAPIDKRGIMVAIKQIVRRFQEETDISIFLQQEWPEIILPGNMEIQVLRIIQETLANIRKHSQANTVRILLRGNAEGEFYVLVEDDGVGFDKPVAPNHRGDHIGLGIMRERAQKLGGKLIVDSESGEGTRITLKFNYPQQKNTQPLSEPLVANN